MKKVLSVLLAIIICFSAIVGGMTVSATTPSIVIGSNELAASGGNGVIDVSGSNYTENCAQILTVVVPKAITVISIDGLTEYDANKVGEENYNFDWLRITDDNNTYIRILNIVDAGDSAVSFSYNININLTANNTTVDAVYDITGYVQAANYTEETLIDIPVSAGKLTLLGRDSLPEDEGFQIPDNDDTSYADIYRTTKPLSDKMPNTFEATVYFPADTSTSTRGGVILGNYLGTNASCLNFEIQTGGHPRIYLSTNATNAQSIVFNKVCVYTGEWVHIAVVRDTQKKEFRCYIDGQLAQTIGNITTPEILSNVNHVLGGDLRSGNSAKFVGYLKNVTLYSDIRTEAEIADDVNSFTNDNILVRYETAATLSPVDGFVDSSHNKNHALREVKWLDEIEALDDYAYSFAVVGDTQILSLGSGERLDHTYEWLENNIESQKIKFVLGLGDITETSAETQWEQAVKSIDRIIDKVPYSLIRGNDEHDSVEAYNKYITYEKYGASTGVGGSYDGTMLNTWQELTVGTRKYLIMGLDFGAKNDVLNWANNIIAAHPKHNVIITTHSYLYRDGTTMDENDIFAPTSYSYATEETNNGDDMWDKLVRKHSNIVLVLSGHDPCNDIVTTKSVGDNGNIVTQMLIDPQGVDNTYIDTSLVAMLYFSEDGSKVQVRYISTDSGKYFLPRNQFDMDLAVASPEVAPTIATTDGNTVTLVNHTGREYSLDGVNWQTSPTFENLPLDTEITFYQRVAATNDSAASMPSIALTVEISSAPNVLIGADCLRVTPKKGYEYSLDGKYWTEDNFFDLYPEVEYTVYAREKNATRKIITLASTVTTNGTNKIAAPTAADLIWLKKQLIIYTDNNQLGADHNADGYINILDFIAMSKDVS